MAKQHVVLSLAIAIGGLAALQGTALAQDKLAQDKLAQDTLGNRGTAEQQMACTPDVFRLCGAQIPDADRIVACLRANVPQLSPGCRAVFEAGKPQHTARRRGHGSQLRPQEEDE
jgi:hypothetical protein